MSYDTDQHKIHVLFYTSNKPSDTDIDKTVPLIMASKRIKCLGIHLQNK